VDRYLGGWDTQLDVDLPDLAECSGGDELPEPQIHGMMQVMEAFHDLTWRGPGDIAHQRCFGRVPGKWLLAEDMLAGIQRVLVPLGVKRVDERVVHDLDLWVVDDFGVRLVNLLDATLCGECLGSGSVAGGHGDEPVAEHS
jgi:hypothetical protein